MKSKLARTIIGILIITISMSIGAFASDAVKKIEAFMRSDFQIVVDGIGSNIGPVFIYEDRSYLPVSQIALALGADVNWDGANKTIYINRRFQGQPEPGDIVNPEMDSILLTYPFLYVATYSGAEHPVLTNLVYEQYRQIMYYRDKDIQRMGFDTGGLRKAKEELTGDIYISERELENVWRQKPPMAPASSLMVIGEPNAVKKQIIFDFINYLPEIEKFINEQYNDDEYRGYPMLLAVDAVGDNKYEILFSQVGAIGREQFGKFLIELRQSSDGTWYNSGYKKVFLN